MSVLRRTNQVQTWHDLDITPGEDWEKELNTHLSNAQVILLLISPDFMDSDYCYSKEMLYAIERHRAGTALVIPVIIRSVFWKGAPFGDLQMLPTDAKAVTLWTDRDAAFEDVVRGIQKSIEKLIAKLSVTQAMRTIEFSIQQGDITVFDTDVVGLKYAQDFYGADELVANALVRVGVASDTLCPNVGDYRYISTRECIYAPNVLFVGVPDLTKFNYQHIREMASKVLDILSNEAPDTRHIAMTIHGIGFGLDEVEALFAQIAGYLDAIERGKIPQSLERISIVEHNISRVSRLRQALETNLSNPGNMSKVKGRWAYQITVHKQSTPSNLASKELISTAISSAGREDEIKSYAFVAMSIKDAEDVFYYGVRGPVRNSGFLCERVDYHKPMGDILEQVRKKMEAAKVVIIELSEINPIVCLELGYAWGKGLPTILLVKKGQDLPFDMSKQRYIEYNSIRNIEENLSKELKVIRF